jgi:ABC-type Fe3+ transport system permease subunit
VVATVNNNMIHVCMGAVYALIYWLQNPFFERYKAFSEPWPWHRPEWKEVLIDTCLLVTFNFFVVLPFLAFAHYFWSLPMVMDFSEEGLPSVGRFVA